MTNEIDKQSTNPVFLHPDLFWLLNIKRFLVSFSHCNLLWVEFVSFSWKVGKKELDKSFHMNGFWPGQILEDGGCTTILETPQCYDDNDSLKSFLLNNGTWTILNAFSAVLTSLIFSLTNSHFWLLGRRAARKNGFVQSSHPHEFLVPKRIT